MLALFVAVLLALSFPLAIYMARIGDAVATGYTPIKGIVGGFERLIYRVSGINIAEDMAWTRYALAVLLFNALGVLAVYLMQRVQLWLPLNPQGMVNLSPDSAFNTAVSF